MRTVYVSGPLTNAYHPEEIKAFYEAIGLVCRQSDFQPYIPHQHSDPQKHSNLSPKDVYELDRWNISQSNLVVAYVGFPSTGVGQEVEIAREYNVPVILIFEAGCAVSRMVRGNPIIYAEITGTDRQSLLDGLGQTLVLFEEHLSRFRHAAEIKIEAYDVAVAA